MHFHRHCHPGRHGGRGWAGAERSGFGPFGGGFRGGGRFRPGKMLGDGELRIVVLALIAEQPRHGYDIIKALEERSHGAYSPSPGIVYPTLTFLDEAGYVTAASEGNKKVYAITDAGRKHLEDNRLVADTVLEGIARVGERMAKARAWYYRQEDAGSSEIPGLSPEVNEARKTLKAAIAETFDAPEDVQRRVAEILRKAADAIRKGSGGNGQ